MVFDYPTFFWGPSAYAHAMCTKPFLLLLLKGLGTRLRTPLLGLASSSLEDLKANCQPFSIAYHLNFVYNINQLGELHDALQIVTREDKL